MPFLVLPCHRGHPEQPWPCWNAPPVLPTVCRADWIDDEFRDVDDEFRDGVELEWNELKWNITPVTTATMTQAATKTTISIATATIAAVTITTQITSTLVGQQQQKQNTNNNNYDDKNRDDNSNSNSNANNFEEGGGSVWSSFVCVFGSLSSLLALSLSVSFSPSLFSLVLSDLSVYL